MTLLAVERIKLFSTRSPWWCGGLAVALTVAFAAMITASTDRTEWISITSTQFGYQFGLAVVMVLAALAITTEYRFGTIRTTFQAVPGRGSALVAKAVVVSILAGVLGLIAAFGSWAIALLIKPEADLALNSAADWRNVAGVSLVFAVAAVIAVAIGTMIRHSAGAVALLLTYALAVEKLVPQIPTIGEKIQPWMPFTVADRFLTGNPDLGNRPEFAGPPPSPSTLEPWVALAYFAAWAVALMAIAVVVAKRRDA